MYSTTLEVVNACIGTLGEAPLNSLDDEHPFKAPALTMLDGSRKTVLKRALWFNTEYITLQPDVTAKYIYIPNDTLHIERVGDRSPPFSQRGRRLYDPVLARYEWDHPVYARLIRDLAFEDCPFYAQDVISLAAILRFQREYDGDTTKYQELSVDMQRAERELAAQHIREVKPNLLDPVRMTMAEQGITRYRAPLKIPASYVIKQE